MTQSILVNSIPSETRIAILEDNRLVEMHLEGRAHRRLLGNIIKGRVSKVLPGIEAAFVDIGLDKDAFLYVMDFFDNFREMERIMLGPEEDSESDPDLNSQALFAAMERIPIEQMLKEGQEILVQVSKEPIGTKGARVTSYINLPGRYVVYMPSVRHIGISRRIKDENERRRLKNILETLPGFSGGAILRTAGEGMQAEDFTRDIHVLQALWRQIQLMSERAPVPSLVYQDADPVYRAVRDFFTPQTNQIILDNEEDYRRCLEFVTAISLSYADRVSLHTKLTPLFEEFGVEAELERALKRKIWLKSGGYLVIDQTEALVAIDVNTGKYTGSKNLEETITQINIEAVKEIARQVRLRNLGGIIIMDFIDMQLPENREKVFHALEEAFANDRSRSKITSFSEMGLIEMTRKRQRRSLGRALTQPCPYCGGSGAIKSSASVANEIYRQLLKLGENGLSNGKDIVVRVHPDMANYLRTEAQDLIKDFEGTTRKKINVKGEDSYHQEQFEIGVG